MLDVESQMLDALQPIERFLQEPIFGMNDRVREICHQETIGLIYRVQQDLIMPNPADRDRLVMRHVLDRDAFPDAVAVVVERFLNLFENEPLADHDRPLVDTIDTQSGIPIVRGRNLQWDNLNYRIEGGPSKVVWCMLALHADLANADFSTRVWDSRLSKYGANESQGMEFSLFTRWDLAWQMVELTRALELPEAAFFGFLPGYSLRPYLLHLQFMLRTWIELNSDRSDLSTKEAILSYAINVAGDVIPSLMPPLSQVVVLDQPGQAVYHFNGQLSHAQRALQVWQPA